MLKEKRLLLLSIGITAMVMGLIIWFSSQPVTDSDKLSLELAGRLLDLFSVEASKQELSRLNHILRKTAHFTLYFILGCGLTGITSHRWRCMPAALCISILLGAAFATTDEFHQFFSEGRGPSLRDVLLDTCGVVAGSLFLALCKYFKNRRRKN